MASVITSKKKLVVNLKAKKHFSAADDIRGELVSSLRKQRLDIINFDSSELLSKIKQNETEIEKCKNKRWLYRQCLDLKEENEKHLKTIEHYKSNGVLEEFDNKMKPLMKRLGNAAKKQKNNTFRLELQEAERIVRKVLTKTSDPIILQHANTGDICDDCGIVMKIIASDSLIGCPQCAKTRFIPVVTASLSLDSDFINNNLYNQKCRLLEWLEFCQAKEYAEPSDEIMNLIMQYLVKNKLTGLEEYTDIISKERQNGEFMNVNNALERLQSKIPLLKEKLLAIKSITIRNAMQNISSKNQDERLRKFYERAPKYSSYISGYWPLRFSSFQEERIKKLYLAACPFYDKFRKPSQPNWPGGYAYFLRCLCVLLGWDEFCNHFNISAGPKNIEEREMVRKKIWAELKWEFVASSPPNDSFKLTIENRSTNKRQRE